MTIAEYLTSIKERLTTESAVLSFHVIRERATLSDGHLRARLTLAEGSQLEFSEYIQRSPEARSALSPTATTGPMQTATSFDGGTIRRIIWT